ncbi:MAG: hypothetical protein ACRCUS_03325 [Anaerovoracaceae bacterium]
MSKEDFGKNKKIAIIISLIVLLLFVINYRYLWKGSMEFAIKKENVSAVATLAKFPLTNLNSYNINYLLLWNWFPEVDYDTALTLAIREGNYEIVEVLIDNGADVNYYNIARGVSPLVALFKEYNKEDLRILSLLLKNGVNVNDDNSHIYDILFQIADQDCAKNLLVKGKDERFYNNEVAVDIKKEFILVWKESISKEDIGVSGANSLFAATLRGNLSLMRHLLNNLNYDPNEKSLGGDTVIFYSYNKYYYNQWTQDVINMLLQYGADKSIKDDERKTAYDYAKEEGAPKEILKLLKP